MSLGNEKTLSDNDQYSVVSIEDRNTLLFSWKSVEGLSVQIFRDGIIALADECRTHKPDRVVIDASALDQSSPAVAWLRGGTNDTEEDYNVWWAREIVPIYNTAGISTLAVGTGDPNAPGELQKVPPGVNFKIGYFADLDAAMQSQF